jgi:ABC-type Fe3+-hydroxamate transport system substrate-binding protein
MNTRTTLTAAVLAACAALTGCEDGVIAQPTPAAAAQIPAYDRDHFGGWADLDGDGCTTREEILTRDSGTGECPPKAPKRLVITDPYTGQRVTGRSQIDIDHVVSLRDAWDSGAWSWTEARRVEFANDETNLLASSDDVNRDKSDADPTGWAPDGHDARCRYASIYWETKRRWELVVTPPQEQALHNLCGGAP